MTHHTIGTTDLRAAAQAVVDRWDTPLWKDAPSTAEYIGRLRTALASAAAQPDTVFMHPMENESGEKGWYLHHPDFYCDLEPSGSGWTIFFRHTATGKEAYAEVPTQGAAIDLKASAQVIAVEVAKNCGSVPQLTFPHIYLGLQDLLATTAQPAPAGVLEDAAPNRRSVNRYCRANMCLESDQNHEHDCPQGHAARKQGGA